MSEQLKINDKPALIEFDTIKFFSQIEKAETVSKKVEVLNKVLNQEPLIKKNLKAEMQKKGQNAGYAQDFDYVPVEVVEEALRQVFFRQVDFEIKTSFRDLNSFVVVATISYKDPVSHEKRVIDGIGAKALQQDKGAKVNQFNDTMKFNALEMGVGIAYSRAVKNAAKKLGKLFGANLNRDEEIDGIVVFNTKALNE